MSGVRLALCGLVLLAACGRPSETSPRDRTGEGEEREGTGGGFNAGWGGVDGGNGGRGESVAGGGFGGSGGSSSGATGGAGGSGLAPDGCARGDNCVINYIDGVETGRASLYEHAAFTRFVHNGDYAHAAYQSRSGPLIVQSLQANRLSQAHPLSFGCTPDPEGKLLLGVQTPHGSFHINSNCLEPSDGFRNRAVSANFTALSKQRVSGTVEATAEPVAGRPDSGRRYRWVFKVNVCDVGGTLAACP